MGFDFSDILKAINREVRDAGQKVQTAKQKAVWVWEAIQGDFNPNRSMGQVGLDMGVCLIPGVDTVMDIRDLIANIIMIVRAPTSGFAWFSLVLTLVGFVPELGSVAKGVVKLVLVKLRPLLRNIDDLTNTSKVIKAVDQAFDEALPEIMMYLRDPRVQKFLTTARIPDVVKKVAGLIRKAAGVVSPAKLKRLFNERANDLKGILDEVGGWLPDAAAGRIKEVKDGIVGIQRSFNRHVDQFVAPAKAIMERIAKRLDEMYWVAWTQQVNKGWIAPVSEAGVRRLIAKHSPAWVKTSKRVKFEQYEPDDLKATEEYLEGLRLGAPKLDDDEIKSFSPIGSRPVKARALRDGETLYRIVDPTSGTFSTSWVTEEVWKQINAADNPRAVWRGGLAIKPDWNQNGQYIKYTYDKARDGEVVVWEGPASAQFLKDPKHPEAGYLEGGLDQIRFHPLKQIKGAKGDDFTGAQFPDMVEGGAIKDAAGSNKSSGVRKEIADDRVQGPFETGWGYKDFDDQHDLIGLPNPNRE
ncbi:MAG: hypothetical protein ACREO4_15770 [Lysobacter sp.]